MKTLEKDAGTRSLGLDLIRAVAAVSVLAVHFFLNTSFYATPLQGTGMLLGSMLRMACMTCVPMFLMLSGYLCTKYRWSLGYYRKLLPVVVTYLLAACVCLFYRIVVAGEPISLLGAFRRILDFSAAPYAWYVEMHIGLFLLIPFINAAWHAMEDRARLAMVLSLIAITALPTTINLKWQILPDFWVGFYPLTYYVLGAWLREHPIRLKRRWLLAGWLLIAAAAGALRFVLAHGGTFTWSGVSTRESLFVLGEAVCLFSCLHQCQWKNCPRAALWCIRRVSRLSFPIYLLSYITDQIIYPVLCTAHPSALSQMLFFPLMVVINLIVTGVMAQVLSWASDGVMKLIPGGKKSGKKAAT